MNVLINIRLASLPFSMDRFAHLANFLLVFGAMLISLFPEMGRHSSVFFMFFLGHLILIAFGKKQRSVHGLTFNGAMLLLDGYAIYVRL